jgi:peptide/nickel transport system substrate-binding protein
VNLVVAVFNDPKGLDPIQSGVNEVQAVSVNIYSKLVRFDSDLRIAPDLADSWDVQNGGRDYVFKLAKNVTWHDGQPFSSADVKFSLEYARQSGHTKSRFADVTGIEAPDSGTIIIKLKNPSAVLLPALAFSGFSILPKHLWEGVKPEEVPARLKPIGTGPFKFEEYVPASHIALVANDKYFREKPGVDKLVFRFIPQIQSAQAALEAGEINALTNYAAPPYRDLARYRNDQRYTVVAWNHYVTYGLTFNFKVKPFDDRRVREAIMRAIDRKKIVDVAYAGVPQPVRNAGPLTPAVAWAFKQDAPDFAFDVTKAQALMDQTGLPKDAQGMRIKTTLDFRISVAGDDDALVLVKDMLKAIGIDLTLNQLDAAAYLDKVQNKKNFALAYVGTGTGPDPDQLTLHYRTSGSFNYGSYSNPQLDELLDKAGQSSGQDIRKPLYYQIQDSVATELVRAPIFYQVNAEVWSREFEGRKPVTLFVQDLASIKRVGK